MPQSKERSRALPASKAFALSEPLLHGHHIPLIIIIREANYRGSKNLIPDQFVFKRRGCGNSAPRKPVKLCIPKTVEFLAPLANHLLALITHDVVSPLKHDDPLEGAVVALVFDCRAVVEIRKGFFALLLAVGSA